MTQLGWYPDNFGELPLEEALQYSVDLGKRALDDKEKGNLSKGLCKLAHLPEVCIKRWDHGPIVQRRIVCAANRYTDQHGKEYIIAGARHTQILMREMVKTLGELGLDLAHTRMDDQGFIDQFEEYHTRKDALIIAVHAGQMREPVFSRGELFSENLY
ncbi:hypothetical protein 2050HW_00142 [Serratia phage vB_SmaM_ 2050HW]|uniref:Uncharacterized protein n=1 Tax=Serratia phage vB_SmaM_ 2050HW TaxID=2024252 RepID=A0A289YVE8_9CAUD|nr:hypothetical protein HWB23_gp142 [Serratia phage vB_SmaM_ 2050HW]ATA65477.1 hypothetical protein 2050HW_00142 [Serratia phage vB_SmaM_ 2050HW]